MSTKSKHFLKKLISWLTSTAIVAGTMVLTLSFPVANAAAATSVITSAKFNAAGLSACQDNILVSFTEPVCGDADCSEGLSVSNFVYVDGSGTAQTISSVTHTAGNDWALITMSGALDAGDTAATLRAEEVHTPSGMLKEDSALTVALTADTTAPTVSVKRFKEAANDLLLQFSEPVQDEQCTNASLANTDFTYADSGADTMTAISTGTSTVHRDWVYLTGDANHAAATDGAETLAPTDNKVYDMVGNEWTEAATAISTFTSDTAIPTISSVYGRIGADTNGGNDFIFANFSEPVFAASTNSGNLAAADFTHSTASVGIATHTAGNTFAVIGLSANQTALGTLDSQGDDDDVFDVFGNALTGATAAVAITDNTFPVIRGVWVNQYIDHGSTTGTAVGTNTAVTNERVTSEATVAYPQEGSKMYKLTDATAIAADEGFMSYNTNIDLYDDGTNDLFEFTQVKLDLYYEDEAGGATNLTSDTDLEFVLNDAADFTTPSRFPITTDLVEKTWTTVTIDLTGTATGTALASQAANPQFWGIRVAGTTNFATSDDLYVDNIRFSRGASSKSNQIYIEYSEAVEMTGDPAEGATGIAGSGIASATTSGDITTSKTLAGMGAFASGTLTTKTLTNTVAKSADGAMYAITLANRSGGVITSASPVTLSGLFTPLNTDANTIEDYAGNNIEAGSTHTPETVVDALDLTTAATAVTDFRPTQNTSGSIRLSWTAPSQTAATFSHYLITYGTSAGVTVGSSLWDESNEAALSTAATSTGTVTSLTDGTTYYFNIASVDTKGIFTTLLTEVSSKPGAATGSSAETTAPGKPTSLAASINDAGKVVLTWTDPTDSDLKDIIIIKSTGAGADPASQLATVAKAVKTYTDTAVSLGEVVNYKLKAVDTNGNVGQFSDTVSITVEIGETAEAEVEEEVVVEEEITEEETVTEEEDMAAEEDIEEDDTMAEEEEMVVPTDLSGHWSEPEVTAMIEFGIVEGDEDTGNVRPDDNLNRAEAAAVLYRVLGLDEPSQPDEMPYSDVDTDEWFAGYIAYLQSLELVTGNPDGTYRPGNNMNRAEFLTLAMRVYYYVSDDDTQDEIDALRAGSKTDAYVDLDDDWYTANATAATELGFVSGRECSGGRCFDANANITRAEATAILYRMFSDYLEERESGDPGSGVTE